MTKAERLALMCDLIAAHHQGDDQAVVKGITSIVPLDMDNAGDLIWRFTKLSCGLIEHLIDEAGGSPFFDRFMSELALGMFEGADE